MSVSLPPAGNKYSRSNENQARRIVENALADLEARLARAEAAVLGGGVTPPVEFDPPVASFTSSIEDLAVTFTDTSTPGDGAIETWLWSFGDGGTSSVQNPSHTYGAAGTYNVTLTVTDANDESDVSAVAQITVVAPPVTAGKLRMGLAGFGNGVVGLGPGDVGAPQPIFSVAGHYQPTTSDINADIIAAEANDVLLSWTLSGGRNIWAPGGVFDMAAWKTSVDRFANNTEVKRMLAERKAVVMLIDEAQHPDFGSPSTISPADVNEMGLYVKLKYPGAITYVRMASEQMAGGWSNVDGVAAPPPGGWTGVDYAFAQYAWNNTRETVAAYYARQRTELNEVDLGFIPGFNFWDGGHWLTTGSGGIPVCWDIENDGQSSGIINGQRGNSSIPDGTHLECGSPDIGQPGCRYIVASPAFMVSAAEAAAADDEAPFMAGFIYAAEGTAADAQWQIDLQRRSDMVDALRDMISVCHGRTNWTGWRTIK